jgi:organic radical activating enzyme
VDVRTEQGNYLPDVSHYKVAIVTLYHGLTRSLLPIRRRTFLLDPKRSRSPVRNRMNIHNVRLGHANNSSSSHSLIFMTRKDAPDNDVEDGQFGWDYFTASSVKARRDYVALTLHASIAQIANEDIADAIVRQWVGDYPAEGYIDHQSQYTLPRSWDGKGVDREFFEDFRNYLLQDGMVILGGNDNDGESHPLGHGFGIAMPVEEPSHIHVVRKDPTGYWTLFNRKTGAKFRITFDHKEKTSAAPVKSYAPELADVKVTNYCAFSHLCPFCYQGSNKEGSHAPARNWQTLASSLGHLRVFEVAIGGGEPTLHPQFLDILHSFRYYGIVPNFTTKNLAWLRDPRQWTKIIDECGSFAHSVQNKDHVHELGSLVRLNGIESQRVSVQVVMGTFDRFTYKEIMEACAVHRIRLTLLGFKTTGLGKDYKVKDHSWWIEDAVQFRKDHHIEMAIDTVLAKDYEKQIRDAGIPRWLYHVDEGKFSCYVDLVESRIGPSSYCDEGDYRPLDFSQWSVSSQITEAYAGF